MHAISVVIFIVGVVATIGVASTLIAPGGGEVLSSALCSSALNGAAETPIQCLREWSNGFAALAALIAGYMAWRSVQTQLREDTRKHKFANTRQTLIVINSNRASIDRLEAIDIEIHIKSDHADTGASNPRQSAVRIYDAVMAARIKLLEELNGHYFTYSTPIGDRVDAAYIGLSKAVNKYVDDLRQLSDDIRAIVHARKSNEVNITEIDIAIISKTLGDCSEKFRCGLAETRRQFNAIANDLSEELSVLND